MLDRLKAFVTHTLEKMFEHISEYIISSKELEELQKMLAYSIDDGYSVVNDNCKTDDSQVIPQQATEINRVYSDKDPKVLLYPKYYSKLLYQQKLLGDESKETQVSKNKLIP